MSPNRAIVVQEKGKAEAAEVTVPELRDDYIIVKVRAVALNPTDWKHIDFGLCSKGARVSGLDIRMRLLD
jgi:NADPH:quinone reductase-like Zn-dependent oxidoreductase